MKKIIDWIKNNKLSSFLIILFIYLFFVRSFTGFFGSTSRSVSNRNTGGVFMELSDSVGEAPSAKLAPTTYENQYEAPIQQNTQDRKVVTESSISLLVDNVRNTMDKIKDNTIDSGGYLVDTSLSRSTKDERATIIVRVPSDRLDGFLETLRNSAVKVTSERIKGYDITDQYSDIQRKIDKIEQTIARLEQIMDQAVEIDDIISIQQRIFSQQDQLDRYKGQLMYMDGASSTSLITINLSTDEGELPYVEPLSWRPDVIFKQASRALILTLQGFGTRMIWIGVFSVLWLPALIAVLVIKKVFFKKKDLNSKTISQDK